MKKLRQIALQLEVWLFFLIVLVAILVRFVQLDTIPSGFSWDEAAIGYNGYGILTTRRDEWLERLPIVFKSFGDYKASVAIYVSAISTALFGLSVWSTRFPMALAGVVTTILSAVFAFQVSRSRAIALLTMALVAISPWNLLYSRIAFESGIAVTLVLIGVMSLYLVLHRPSFEFLKNDSKTLELKDWPSWILFGLYALSAVSFSVSMYAYHSPKITIPLLLVVFTLSHWKRLLSDSKFVVPAIVLGTLMVYPLAMQMLFGPASERFFMTSSLIGEATVPQKIGTIVQSYFSHLDLRFLLFGMSDSYRHGTGVFGVLSYVEVIGLIAVVYFWRSVPRVKWMLVLMIAIAILPAGLSEGAPHSNRAHGVVPFVQLLSAFGLFSLMNAIQKKVSVSISKLLVIVVVLILLQVMVFAPQYVRVYRSVASDDFQEGYLEAFTYARSQEYRVDRVVVSSAYGQPYIFALFVKKLTPIQWQHGALGNYEFRELDWEKDQTITDTLFIGLPEDIPDEAVEHKIFSASGEERLRVARVINSPAFTEGEVQDILEDSP